MTIEEQALRTYPQEILNLGCMTLDISGVKRRAFIEGAKFISEFQVSVLIDKNGTVFNNPADDH